MVAESAESFSSRPRLEASIVLTGIMGDKVTLGLTDECPKSPVLTVFMRLETARGLVAALLENIDLIEKADP